MTPITYNKAFPPAEHRFPHFYDLPLCKLSRRTRDGLGRGKENGRTAKRKDGKAKKQEKSARQRKRREREKWEQKDETGREGIRRKQGEW
ncbi:hypothetical protein E2C01_082659 [Portunus trituberculatus]|uniref:Uncharacterized protein n=1 Tax=Portunus trituberculatus TaxID=210409 RepID=A0A5B7J1F4_PORTR|nr:hypothetical protein [Portunus trituberculatus]